jgi:hypothetical protein
MANRLRFIMICSPLRLIAHVAIADKRLFEYMATESILPAWPQAQSVINKAAENV